MGFRGLEQNPSPTGEPATTDLLATRVTRGASFGAHAALHGEPSSQTQQGQQFSRINVVGLDVARVELERNGFTVTLVPSAEKPMQAVFYLKDQVELVQRWNRNGKPDGETPPDGVKKTNGKWRAYPVMWTDAATNMLAILANADGSVECRIFDKSSGLRDGSRPRLECWVLSEREIYSEAQWAKGKSEAAQADSELVLPAGSPGLNTGTSTGPQPISYNGDYGIFSQYGGLYSAAPASRYAFMGWSRPKTFKE